MVSLTIVWIAAGIVAGVIVLGWAYRTANRLDRLNVRVDLARQSLFAALDRRAVVARGLGAVLTESPSARDAGQALIDAAVAAEAAPTGDRESAENRLAALLAGVDVADRPVAFAAELADAEIRVMMARRFYNDAVRDTRSLAGRRVVRLLHLAGHAPMPVYFEINERVTR